MSREIKAFVLSTGLHAIIVISLFAVGNTITYTKPILIDFNLEEIDTVKEGIKKSTSSPRHERVRKEEKRIEPQKPVKEMVKKEVEPIRESPVTDTFSEEQAPVPPVTQKVLSSLAETGKESKSSISEAEGTPATSSGNNRAIETAASGGTIDSTEKARQRYLKEHFTYIRDIITRNISYPFMARKMGWSGKVTVSFVITEDGSVRDIKIIESSGFDVLDRNAAETVRRVSPFPKPPVRAEVIVPVVYRLN